MFITIEGPEGVGKTTLINNLKQEIRFKQSHFTKGLGGNDLGLALRDIAFTKSFNDPKARFLLMLTALSDLYKELETKYLSKNIDVISDRWTLSTYAYGKMDGLSTKFCSHLLQATLNHRPSLSIVLTHDSSELYKRIKARTYHDNIEAMFTDDKAISKLDLLQQYYAEFSYPLNALSWMESMARTTKYIDSHCSQDELVNRVMKVINDYD